jgi:hypothetical protein
VKRDCAHLCTKDERQPRAKRIKTKHTEQNRSQVTPEEEEEPEVEETAQILEHFVDVIPLPTETAGVARDISNRYWVTQDPQRHDQKLALIRDVIHALPEWDIVQLLYEVFVTRCQGPLGNVVHTPSFMKQADQLRHCLSMASPDAAIASTLSMDSLACLLLAVLLSFKPAWSSVG